MGVESQPTRPLLRLEAPGYVSCYEHNTPESVSGPGEGRGEGRDGGRDGGRDVGVRF